MFKTFTLGGKKYRLNLAKFESFMTALTLGAMALAAFVFFFGFCWGGFLR